MSWDVASRAEAWIETACSWRICASSNVASRAEAWIETVMLWIITPVSLVASRAEAWIETPSGPDMASPNARRLPCGGVD